jgi:hypothetical protein
MWLMALSTKTDYFLQKAQEKAQPKGWAFFF